MDQTTGFWWIRHAVVTETDGKVYGQSDVNCDCSDTEQLVWLAATLPTEARIVTSSLVRTHQTAEAVRTQGFGGRHIACYPELNEQCFGIWEGLDYKEIRARYGKSSQKFWLAPAGQRPPSTSERTGESFCDLTTRTHRAVQKMLDSHAGDELAVFAHGGTIRAALAIALGLYTPDDPDRLDAIFTFRIENLSLTRIEHTRYTDENGKLADYWRIRAFNALKTQP